MDKLTQSMMADIKDDYIKLLNSGMFFELYPELTGNWEKDQEQWHDFQASEKIKKEYDKLLDEIEQTLSPVEKEFFDEMIEVWKGNLILNTIDLVRDLKDIMKKYTIKKK